MPNLIERFWNKIRPSAGCWEWIGARTDRGYGIFCRGKQRVPAHRYMAWLMSGKTPEVVRHTCDNPGCVNPAHLRNGTQSDNMLDCAAKGRHGPYGEQHGSSKLTAAAVRVIRKSAATNEALARRYSVDRSTVRRARGRETWRHV